VTGHNKDVSLFVGEYELGLTKYVNGLPNTKDAMLHRNGYLEEQPVHLER